MIINFQWLEPERIVERERGAFSRDVRWAAPLELTTQPRGAQVELMMNERYEREGAELGTGLSLGVV